MRLLYVCSRCQARHQARAPATSIRLAQNAAARGYHASTPQRPLWAGQPSFRHKATPIKSTASPGLWRPQSTLGLSKEPQDATAPLPSRPSVPLSPDKLFHPLTASPAADLRKRAQLIKRHAYCPHPSHQRTRPSVEEEEEVEEKDHEEVEAKEQEKLPPAHSHFECPDCGVPLYCSEEHWAEDYEAHLKLCDTLRQINEDEHDLRSGRQFTEFYYPPDQIIPEAVINMMNWDTFLYTRQFEAINEMQRMRQLTKLLTYPVTVGSVIHELSPYSYGRGGRLTIEGVKSFSALQYTLHPPRSGAGTTVEEIKPNPPMVRIFVLGARAESSLPREVWTQLVYMFPNALVNVIFIGPESMVNRESEGPLPERTPENPFGMIVEDRLGPQLKINTFVDYFHEIHQTGYFEPYDPYFDCFMLYHPGFGNPVSSPEWEPTLPQLLETKVPIICTGYSQEDMQQDVKWLERTAQGEYDMLLQPGENIFRSLRWDLNEQNPTDPSCANWGVWAFRGKRYDTIPRKGRIDETRRIN